ncbi:MAG: zinc-dependent alcohol dehydrogenase family protein [Pseudomonadota bacterium]
MARIVTFDALGGPEMLQLRDRDLPPPGPGEALVEVRAAGLNRAELLFLGGRYLVEPRLPGARLGVEGAGIVRAVGEGVQEVAIGDRVAILPSIPMQETGVLGEATIVPASALVPIPEGKSFQEAAAFWMAYGTAWGMMVQAGRLEAGQTVLVTGASSSVGIAAFQVARDFGATVIATTRGPGKVEALKDAGAHHVIVTDEEDLADRAREITEGRGVDLVCDAIGGPMVQALAAATADGGRIVLMGLQSGEIPKMPFYDLLGRGLTLTGFHLVWHLLDRPDARRAAVAALVEGWRAGTLTPVIDQTFPLERVAEAYDRMASNAQVGKIVVTMERQSPDAAD